MASWYETWESLATLFSKPLSKALNNSPQGVSSQLSNTPYARFIEASNAVQFKSSANRLLDKINPNNHKEIRRLITSSDPAERSKGADNLFRLMDKIFTNDLGGSSKADGLIADIFEAQGPDALLLIPQINMAWRRNHQWRQKEKLPELNFKQYLEETKNDAVIAALKSFLHDKHFLKLRPVDIYLPARGLRIPKRTDEFLKTLEHIIDNFPGDLIVDLLLRKMSNIRADNTLSTIQHILKTGKISKIINSADSLMIIPKGLRYNFQGNIGELFSFPFKLERLAAATKLAKKSGGEIMLFRDVRVKGERLRVLDTKVERYVERLFHNLSEGGFVTRKNLEDAIGTKQAKELLDFRYPEGIPKDLKMREPPSYPVESYNSAALEFSDDLLVHQKKPGSGQFSIKELFETKASATARTDGHTAIQRNIENMSKTKEVSVGEIIVIRNGKEVKLGINKNTAKELGGKLSDDGKSIILRENKEFLEQDEALLEKLSKNIDDIHLKYATDFEARPLTKEAEKRVEKILARREKAIALLLEKFEKSHPKRNLEGLLGCKKWLLGPSDKLSTGNVSNNIHEVDFNLTYDELVNFVNLLLLRCDFKTL